MCEDVSTGRIHTKGQDDVHDSEDAGSHPGFVHDLKGDVVMVDLVLDADADHDDDDRCKD